MRKLEGPATLVGVSELRTHLEDVLKAMKDSRVVLERRNRPIAVLLPVDQYQQMERMCDWVEDQILGFLAHERERKAGKVKFLDLAEAEKLLGLRA